MARLRDDAYEDDDDFEEDEPRPRRGRPPQAGARDNSTLLILAIVGGTVLGVFVICGGIVALVVYSAYSAQKAETEARDLAFAEADKRRAEVMAEVIAEAAKNPVEMIEEIDRAEIELAGSQAAANGFFLDLKKRRYAEAWQAGTAALQKRFPTERDLEAFVSQHPEIHRANRPTLVDVRQRGPRKDYSTTVLESGKRIELLISVVKEENAWKVDQLTVK